MKKLILIAFMLSSFNLPAFAGHFYVGPTLLGQHTFAKHTHFDGIHPRLSLGYANSYQDDLYFAYEIFGVPATATLSESHDDPSVSVKTTHSIGFSFIIGTPLSDALLGFVRVGGIRSTFSGPDQSKSGVQGGFGIQTPLSTAWNIHAEYIYTAYQSISVIGTPKSNEIGIGLTYSI